MPQMDYRSELRRPVSLALLGFGLLGWILVAWLAWSLSESNRDHRRHVRLLTGASTNARIEADQLRQAGDSLAGVQAKLAAAQTTFTQLEQSRTDMRAELFELEKDLQAQRHNAVNTTREVQETTRRLEELQVRLREADARLAAKMPLNLNIQVYTDTLAHERVLLGQLTDFTNASKIGELAMSPRFKSADYPVLEVETEGSVPFRSVLYLYLWWKASGTLVGVRDSYHMLRSSPFQGKLEPGSYTDTFVGIPNRTGMAEVSFYLQSNLLGLATGALDHRLKRISLFGRASERVLQDEGFRTKYACTAAGGVVHTVSLPRIKTQTGKEEIIARGARFSVPDVMSFSHLDRGHRIQTKTDDADILLGAMHPQSVVYQMKSGEYRSLSFGNADLVRVGFSKASGKLDFEVFAYDFRERSTRSSKLRPDAHGRRVHPNLGLVKEVPDSEVTISHTRSSVLVVPLWQPEGRLASLAFTEHADLVGVQQDAVTMYGNAEEKVIPGEGFIGNRIPLTKTVFPGGAQATFASRTAHSETTGTLHQPRVNQAEFVDQLRRYKSTGVEVEIGAHCSGLSLQQDEPSSAAVRSALQSLGEFNPTTWVDHGGYDCLWESGWDPNSGHYVVPALRETGIRYLNALGDKYGARLSLIESGEPSNLVFSSPGLDDNLDDGWIPTFFNTTPLGFGKDVFTPEHLEEIIIERGFLNLHTYLAYEALVLDRDESGNTIIKPVPWYNQHLQNIAAARDRGDLYLATTRDLLDYVGAARQVLYFTTGSRVTAWKSQGSPLPGFTLGMIDVDPSAKGGPPEVAGVNVLGSRTRDGVSYQWFDVAQPTAPISNVGEGPCLP